MRSTILLLFTLCLHFICIAGYGQIITTVAGCDDTALGDGGSATQASLNGPYGVTLDGLGNYYITDGYHNRIRKVDAAGNISTIAGTGWQGFSGDNGPATAAELYRPVGIVCDPAGNIYFCDAYNNRVRKINANGIISTVAGNGSIVYNGDNIPATTAAIYDPHSLTLDRYGNVYITDFGNSRVRKVNASGIITTIAGSGIQGCSGDNGPATKAKINGPYGITLDKVGNIYFADYYAGVIREVDAFGTITTIAGNTDSTNIGDGGAATAAALNYPAGIIIAANNTIYISGSRENRIRKVTEGIVTTIAGNGILGFSGDNGSAIDAQLSGPCGITIDAARGTIYFTDFYNDRVRRIECSECVDKLPEQYMMDLFPNPNNGRFTCIISSPYYEVFDIKVVNMLGQIVLTDAIYARDAAIITLVQPPGIYILSATGRKGTINKKFVITR